MANVERINLGDFDAERYPAGWVDVRTKRGFHVERKIRDAQMKIVPKPGVDLDELSASTVDLIFDGADAGTRTLEAHVIAWTLTDDAGAALPVSRAGFESEDFDADLGEWLIERIEEIVKAHRRSKSVTAGVGGGA